MAKPYMYAGPRRIAAALKLAGMPDDKIVEMVATHGAETSGNVWAIGGPNKNGTFDFGAFQINVPGDVTKADSLFPGWDNYITNARYAVALWEKQGFKAWYGYAKIDQVAGFAKVPSMTWRQWAQKGFDAYKADRAKGYTYERICSLYFPLDGVV